MADQALRKPGFPAFSWFPQQKCKKRLTIPPTAHRYPLVNGASPRRNAVYRYIGNEQILPEREGWIGADAVLSHCWLDEGTCGRRLGVLR
jgi:hypothetical protein